MEEKNYINRPVRFEEFNEWKKGTCLLITGGMMSDSVMLIEREDGTIATILIGDVQFTDRETLKNIGTKFTLAQLLVLPRETKVNIKYTGKAWHKDMKEEEWSENDYYVDKDGIHKVHEEGIFLNIDEMNDEFYGFEVYPCI